MNILLLTSLYPDFKSTTYQRQTKALHNFTKYWVQEENVNVLVIKMHFYPRDEKTIRHHHNYSLDQVPIFHNFQYDQGVFRWSRFHVRLIPLYVSVKLRGTHLFTYNMQGLSRILQKNSFRPDIVLSHSMLTFQPGHYISEIYRIPLLLGLHKSDVLNWQKQGKWKHYIDQYSDKAAGLVFRSPSVKRALPENDIIESKPYYTALSGIPKEWLISQKEATEKLTAWKSGSRPIRIVTVCNLQKLKNIDINLKVLHRLKEDQSFYYDIIGDGVERENLESLSKSLGLSERVRFHGRLSHAKVLENLASTDLFLMVSQPETFGLAYLEAIAKGNLVIAAKGEGIDGVFAEDEVLFTRADHEESLYTVLKNDILLQPEAVLKNRLLNSMEKIKALDEKKVALDYLSFIRSIENA